MLQNYALLVPMAGCLGVAAVCGYGILALRHELFAPIAPNLNEEDQREERTLRMYARICFVLACVILPLAGYAAFELVRYLQAHTPEVLLHFGLWYIIGLAVHIVRRTVEDYLFGSRQSIGRYAFALVWALLGPINVPLFLVSFSRRLG